ncbi:hypothetical protein Glove_856g7 [Diversispora epigaea]|uniref:Protein kinase domain-containing protein n=1 Tax=Diversispora epigaea TaxID=1348612 RepID=A0A397G2H4_9GLOM|nr:hypothetical protein Glove_856g7 [Diversispora epigaea]
MGSFFEWINKYRFQEVILSFTLDNTSTFLKRSNHPILYVTNSLGRIHFKNIVHRDLHSGNILYNSRNTIWRISDLGLSGPVDKPSNSIYGNLPYIALEVICNILLSRNTINKDAPHRLAHRCLDVLAFDSKQLELEISEEMEQQYLKIIGADNSNKSCGYLILDDQEYGVQIKAQF